MLTGREIMPLTRAYSVRAAALSGWRGIVALVIIAIPTLGQNQPVDPPKLALLVGINEYAHGETSPPALSGCVNDVARMKALLEDRFGFESDGIGVLLNEAATHEAIVRKFDEHLLRRVQPGSSVVIYLSGHGSRIPDASGERSAEPDGFDSTFLAYDSRAGKLRGERDVTDDELRSLLMTLTRVTDQVVVITDTCHSGGVVRGGDKSRSAAAGITALDRDWLSEFWPEDVPLVEDGLNVALNSARYVHVAAAERDQRAWELELSDETGAAEHHGAMTYFLTEALERATPKSTWREVIADTAVRVATRRFQTVNFQGGVDREVFGGKFRAVKGFRAEVKGRVLIVRAGSLVGLRVGSILEVSGNDGVKLGRAKVLGVTPSIARAAWETEAPDPLPTGALRVLELSRGSDEPLLRVRLELDTCKLPDELAFMNIVGKHEPAEYVILEREDGLYFRTMEGVALHAAPISKTKGLREALEEVARHETRWRALCDLAAERGQLPLVVSIRPATSEEAKEHPSFEPAMVLASPDASVSGRSLRVRGGAAPKENTPSRSLVMLELTNPHDKDLYVSVLSLEEARKISVVFPLGQKCELIPAGKTRTRPISIQSREVWSLDRPMRDRYLAVAWTKPFDLKPFERGEINRSEGSAAPPLLARTLVNNSLRGSTTTSYRGWGLSFVDVLVKTHLSGQ
ncbi:MAG: hypothetical protein ACI8TQ_000732 [Planctomycetota bacterium]|jgi:hypothetical protein